MPISNFHKVIPLSSLGVLITGTSFSYVATPSEGNFSLLGPHLAISWYILFEKKLVGGTSIPDQRVVTLLKGRSVVSSSLLICISDRETNRC